MDDDARLKGLKILVIEDDFLVAQVLVALLEDAGAEVVGPIGWLEEALTFIELGPGHIDAAVLDVNLHGQRSYPIAKALTARNIRVLFASGYGAEAIDERFRSYPRCSKPYNETELFDAILA